MMKQRFTHILLAFAAGLVLASCNIYNDPDGAGCSVAGPDGMSVNFSISAGNPAYYGTKASSYGAPSLENGTEWENYVNISSGDYLFYLFDGEGDAVFLFIHVQHHDLYDVAHGEELAGVLDKLVGNLGDVDEAVLMDADIHKDAKVDNIAHGACEHHAGL